MSNQFFADLDRAMQPRREAEIKVIAAARMLSRAIHGDRSTSYIQAMYFMDAALDNLDFVEHPTQFCTVPKGYPMGHPDYWQTLARELKVGCGITQWHIDHYELCGRPAYYNNRTRCQDHKDKELSHNESR